MTDHSLIDPPGGAAAAPVIEVNHLTKSFRARRVLNDINVRIAPGRIVGLMGDNGAGKTTLLKILAGVLANWSGDVRIAGSVPGPASKAKVSFLPDTSFLAPHLRAADAIAQFERFFDDFDAVKARSMVDFFGLPWDVTLKNMSKGMREKVQIALAMSRNASVYLLDEPISGVDPASRDVILRGILSNLNDGSTLLLSTHLISDVEAIVDDVIFLRAGHVLLEGSADDLREEHGLGIDALFRKVYAA